MSKQDLVSDLQDKIQGLETALSDIMVYVDTWDYDYTVQHIYNIAETALDHQGKNDEST